MHHTVRWLTLYASRRLCTTKAVLLQQPRENIMSCYISLWICAPDFQDVSAGPCNRINIWAIVWKVVSRSSNSDKTRTALMIFLLRFIFSVTLLHSKQNWRARSKLWCYRWDGKVHKFHCEPVWKHLGSLFPLFDLRYSYLLQNLYLQSSFMWVFMWNPFS